MEDVNEFPFTQKTIDTLGTLVTRPHLRPKLLAKPPFRFIHDIVTATLAITGFPAGLYDEQQLNSKNVTEKEQKIKFLTMLFQAIEDAIQQTVQCNPIKVIMGLEPEKTNIALQQMYEAAVAVRDGRVNMKQIVEHVVGSSDDATGNTTKSNAQTAEQTHQTANDGMKSEAQIDFAGKNKNEDEFSRKKQHVEETALQQQRPDEEQKQHERATSATETVTNRSVPNDASSNEFPYTQLTIDTLGTIVTKPQLKPKLLAKPPFRFLHDIVTATMASTGFPEGVFPSALLSSENVKEKEKKLEYLTILFKAISTAIGKPVACNPIKVIAGLEPESTNIMLQQLYQGAVAVRDGKLRMIDVLASMKSGTPLAALSVNEKSGKQQNLVAANSQAVKKQTDSMAIKPQGAERQNNPVAVNPQDARKPNDPVAINPQGAKKQNDPVAAKYQSDVIKKDISSINEQKEGPNLSSSKVEQGLAIPTMRSSVASTFDSGLPIHAAPVTQQLARPRTARRPPPKLKSNLVEENAKPEAEPSLPSGVIIEDGKFRDETDDNETEKVANVAHELNDLPDSDEPVDIANAGRLVKHIVSKLGTEEKTNDDKSGMRISSAQRALHGMSTTQIDELKDQIQKLCQSANPLGKIMDSVYDDIDMMHKEMHRWKQDFKTNTERLESERRQTEKHLIPLQNQLANVEKAVQQKKHKIQMLKASIILNEQQINGLIKHIC